MDVPNPESNVHRVTDAHGRSVIVKTITRNSVDEPLSVTDDRVRRHAQLLEQARHPGVVEFLRLEHHDRPTDPRGGLALVLAPIDGPSLADTELVPSEVAGVLAATANTVAHLHDRKIVHGALRADHVLLEHGARPRLCGFGTALGDPSRRASDDVHALAMLARTCLGPWRATAPNDHPDPPAARRRTPPWKRATAGLAGPASDAVIPEGVIAERLHLLAGEILGSLPDKRMSCRALADRLAALPGARLPRPVDSPSGTTTEAGADPFEDAPLDQLARLRRVAPHPRDHRTPHDADDSARVGVVVAHPAKAPASAPSDHGAESLPPPEPGLRQPDIPTPTDAPDCALAPPGVTTHPSTAAADGGTVSLKTTGVRRRVPRSSASAALVAIAALVASVVAVQTARREASRRAPNEPTADNAPEHASGPVTSNGGGTFSALPSIVARTTLMNEGPTPETVARTPTTTAAPAAPASAAPALRSAGKHCPPPVRDSTIGALLADVDGSGCGVLVTVQGNALLAGATRFTLGEPGDQIVLGDWDGDGWVTPAILQRASGVLFRYDDWPQPGTPLTGRQWGRHDPSSRLVVRNRGAGPDTVESASATP